MNIAAALSLAGIGFDRTRLTVVADPALKFNTHFVRIRGASGSIDLRFENVPSPDNPRTAMLAGFSALAAFKQFNRRCVTGPRDRLESAGKLKNPRFNSEEGKTTPNV